MPTLYRFVRGTLTAGELDMIPESTALEAAPPEAEPEPEPEACARREKIPEVRKKRPAERGGKKHGGAHRYGIDKKKALALAGAAAAVYIIGRMLKGRK